MHGLTSYIQNHIYKEIYHGVKLLFPLLLYLEVISLCNFENFVNLSSVLIIDFISLCQILMGIQ